MFRHNNNSVLNCQTGFNVTHFLLTTMFMETPVTFWNSHITVLEFSSRERKNSTQWHFNGSLWWKTRWCGGLQELGGLSSLVSTEPVNMFSARIPTAASWTGGVFAVALASNGKLAHMLPELVSVRTFGWTRTSSMGDTLCRYHRIPLYSAFGGIITLCETWERWCENVTRASVNSLIKQQTCSLKPKFFNTKFVLVP